MKNFGLPEPEPPVDPGAFPFPQRWAPPRPDGSAYPLPPPLLRERQTEFERLVSAVVTVFHRSVFPSIETRADRVRLEAHLARFLYAPGSPYGVTDDD